MAELARSFRPASEPLPVTWMASDTCGADKLDHDRDRLMSSGTDTRKSFLPSSSQTLTRLHCAGYQSAGTIYRGPRPLLEYKHLTEVGYHEKGCITSRHVEKGGRMRKRLEPG